MGSNETLRVLIAGLAASGALGLAQAQTAPAEPAPAEPAAASKSEPARLAPVNVTATRRDEPLQQVPIPVTVIDRQLIRDGGLQDLKAFVELTPNATLPTSSSNNTNQDVIIRGVRNPGSGGSSAVEPGFGLFREGNYNGGTVTNLGSFLDVARVEVLRGPQGGLYGRNAVGGAINVIYEKPRDQFGGLVNVLLGEYGTTDIDAVINTPLAESLNARIVAWSQHRDGGEVKNSFLGENLDKTRENGGRLRLNFQATDALSFDWVAESSRGKAPLNTYFVPNGRTHTFAGLPANFTLGPAPIPGFNLGFAPIGTQAPETETTIQRDTLATLNRQQDYLSQEIGFDAGDLGTFALVTTYRKSTQDGFEDQDVTAINPATNPRMTRSIGVFDIESTNKFAELRWVSPDNQPLTWVGGISYYREDLTNDRRFELLRIDPDTGDVPGRVDFLGSQKTTSTSIFGEINYLLTPDLRASASLRYTKDDRSLEYTQGLDQSLPYATAIYVDIPALFISPYGAVINAGIPAFSASREASFSNTSPGASLSYKLSKDVGVFGRIQTGFRSGGYNLTAPIDKLAFEPETAINYELGVKSDWLDNTLRVNAAVFHMRQKDVLLPESSVVAGSPLGYLVNAGRSRTTGFELELNALVARGLTIGAALGFLDAEMTEGVDGTGASISGKDVPYAAPWTANLIANYRTPIAADLTLFVFGSYTFRDAVYTDQANTVQQESFGLVDGSIGVESKSWSLTLIGRNLFDERYENFRSAALTSGEPQSYLTSLSPGRWLGVRGTYKF